MEEVGCRCTGFTKSDPNCPEWEEEGGETGRGTRQAAVPLLGGRPLPRETESDKTPLRSFSHVLPRALMAETCMIEFLEGHIYLYFLLPFF